MTVFGQDGRRDHVVRVNTFASAPMESDREFTGQGVLELSATTDQTDFDVIVKLSLVPGSPEAAPALKVSQGCLRASHRAEDAEPTTELPPFHSHQSEEPVTPGEVYRLRIQLLPMSFVARAGDGSALRSQTRIR